MTTDSLFKTQAALYVKLTEAAGVTDLLAAGAESVMDEVPADAVFPYIVIGEVSAKTLDTQGHQGRDVTATIHSYSRGRGMKEIKNIMSAIFETLHDGALSVAGQTIVLCQEISADAFIDNDGETRRGIQKFRIITETA